MLSQKPEQSTVMLQQIRSLQFAPRLWLFPVSIAIFCGGCVYDQAYPDNWAPIASKPDLCSHLNGDFSPYDYYSRFIISWIAPSKDNPDHPIAADKLDFKISGNTLLATAFLNGQELGQKQYEIQCGKTSLSLDLGSKFEAGQGTVGYSTHVLHFQMDSSGALVVNHASSGIGAYGPIPFGGSSSAWVARFVPYVPDAVVPQDPSTQSGKIEPCTYNVSHIVLDTEEEADKVENALQQGQDFARLAGTENSHYLMRLTEGKLGWVKPDYFPTLASTMTSLKKGEYNHVPVKDKLGWHILKINDIRPAVCTPTPASQ